MRLHHKLLLPLVAVFAAVLGYVTVVWIPLLRADADATFRVNIARHLDSVSEILVPLLLTSQIDVVHENMEALLEDNPDWRAVIVTDRDGRQVFPLRGVAVPEAGPGETFFRLEQPVMVGSMVLGRLTVVIDRTATLDRQNIRFLELGAAFAGFAFLMLVLALLVMEGAVLRPLRQLARASRAKFRKSWQSASRPGPRRFSSSVRKLLTMRSGSRRS